jgi:hypothetical protein
MLPSRLDSPALPIMIAEHAAGRVVGFARSVAVARETAAIWAAARGQHVLGLVCSARFTVDPTTNDERTYMRARHARRAWLVLTDELVP